MYFLQIVDDRKTKNVIREKCMESVKRFVNKKDKYEVKEVRYNSDAAAMVNEMDKIRFAYAREHDDLLYVDSDCFLVSLPTEEQMKKNEIIMGEAMTGQESIVDTFLFYVNGQSGFFLNNYEALIKPHQSVNISPEQLQLFKNRSIPFDQMAYSYHSLMSIESTVNNQLKVILDRLTEAEKEIAAYRNSIQSMVSTAELYNKLREKQR